MRRLAVLALVVCVLFSLASTAPASADAWTRPVRGRVVRPFDPPKTKYGPGHLGADLEAPRGALVRAAGPGSVVFAGAVGATSHVVVRHANGWRTSYSFLASVRVHVNQQIDAGAIVGTSGGTGENHDGSVLHFALRIGDTYVDPMQLFEAVDLPSVVHLAPVDGPPVPTESGGLLAGLASDDNPLICGRWRSGWCG